MLFLRVLATSGAVAIAVLLHVRDTIIMSVLPRVPAQSDSVEVDEVGDSIPCRMKCRTQ
jgi:hypothetical protein